MIPTWSPIELSLDDEYIQEPILITPRSKAFNIKSKEKEESNSTLSTSQKGLISPHLLHQKETLEIQKTKR